MRYGMDRPAAWVAESAGGAAAGIFVDFVDSDCSGVHGLNERIRVDRSMSGGTIRTIW